ncbi:putative cytochrome P450 oxidoreductase [Lasiosphaeria hispida]|uniref:Cytochrome P450 oxidoreductase n=1 Tax=Lasiosphaeria hispida TaxID=260671 RepID=A0AAJ0H833_9PEZI|nr:putative cytochrome P450 oxidoreductase [Lasiosphaeria hispida]
MAPYLALAVALCVVQVLRIILRLARNVRTARLSGLPYTLSPIHELQGLAYITDPLLRWCYRDYLLLGRGWPRWARFMVKDWHYEDRNRAHEECGPVFLVVSPGGLVCYVGHAETALHVVTRRKAFIKPPEKMKMLEPFGPNVVSVDGNEWRFHLGITLPPLAADGVHRTVWEETQRQVGMMVAAWRSSSGPSSVKTNIYTLTVNTMSLVGFGKATDWADADKAVPPGHTLSVVGAIWGVVMHLPHILLLPKWALARSPWQVAYRAYVEFDQYMDELLAAERERLKLQTNTAEMTKDNLLTAVLRSSMANQEASQDVDEKEKGRASRTSLTDGEIKGNVFIFLLAGYDTTANTILFCVTVLALYPDIQQRIREEIDRIHTEAEQAGRSNLSFADDFPKFRYLVAFMYEVMRVFPIVLPIARVTAGEEGLRVGSSSHHLPAGTGVIVNNTAIHYSETNWPAPEVIEPRRWLVSDPHAVDPSRPLTAEQEDEIRGGRVPIPACRKGTFLTFSEGPRACLGRTFARVEFVAFFSRLLRHHRLRLDGSVSSVDVEKVLRLRSGGSPVTLIPPEDVRICLDAR